MLVGPAHSLPMCVCNGGGRVMYIVLCICIVYVRGIEYCIICIMYVCMYVRMSLEPVLCQPQDIYCTCDSSLVHSQLF